jgi:muramidase (phage lysozyme)
MHKIAAAAALSILPLFAPQGAQAEFNSLSEFTISTKNVFNYDVRPYMPQDAVRLSAGTITEASYQRPRDAFIDGKSAPLTNLKHLIGWAEAGRNGYDAVQHGARIGPNKRPTQMTIGQIKQWIRATPGQPHAIGRYQFIPATLDTLVREIGFSANTVFTADVQDRLADLLLEDAGYSLFVDGKVSRHQFMDNLAKIWAGFPTSTGRSFYHGYAGNYATISWNEFDHHMASIFRQ